jgi:hypothetical protein
MLTSRTCGVRDTQTTDTNRTTIRFRYRLSSAKALWLVLVMGFSPAGALSSSRSDGIEQSIAGVRLGDTVATARKRFPELKETGGAGVWTISVGSNCTLEVVALDGPHILTITLARTRRQDHQSDRVCDAVKTGAGMRFGADLSDVRRFYNGVTLATPGSEPALYRTDNGAECLSGRSPVLREMLVYWSNAAKRIETLSIDASEASCQEYRDTERVRKQEETPGKP